MKDDPKPKAVVADDEFEMTVPRNAIKTNKDLLEMYRIFRDIYGIDPTSRSLQRIAQAELSALDQEEGSIDHRGAGRLLWEPFGGDINITRIYVLATGTQGNLKAKHELCRRAFLEYLGLKEEVQQDTPTENRVSRLEEAADHLGIAFGVAGEMPIARLDGKAQGTSDKTARRLFDAVMEIPPRNGVPEEDPVKYLKGQIALCDLAIELYAEGATNINLGAVRSAHSAYESALRFGNYPEIIEASRDACDDALRVLGR